ncbi:MAG TPA: hypothetical protein VMR89_02955 [Actinomycetota bacterium]|nr:hypothetical protein [Actinomycetota bacterium]
MKTTGAAIHYVTTEDRRSTRVAKLIEEGRMTEAGLAEVERVKQDGRWGGR